MENLQRLFERVLKLENIVQRQTTIIAALHSQLAELQKRIELKTSDDEAEIIKDENKLETSGEW